MKKCRDNLVECLFFVSIIILAALLINMIFAADQQESEPEQIGKIFTKQEADSLFGPVLSQDSINTRSLELELAGCENYVMINEFDGILVIVNEKKEILSQTVFDLQNADLFHVFSKSKVIELLENGGERVVYFQIREEVFSIGNGDFILEVSDLCPPICFWQ